MAINNERHIFHVFGLKRNGNHPIINWLIENIKTTYSDIIFLNDVNHKSLAVEDTNKASLDHNIVFLSYEEVPIDNINIVKYLPPFHAAEAVILILRDVGNSLASRIEYISKFKSDDININDYFLDNQLYIDYWIQYAREFVRDCYGKYKCINFNKWFSSRDYRDEMFRVVTGLKNEDLSVKDVPKHGGGSSFDSLDYNGCANKMAVLNRWEDYIDNPEFVELIIKNSLLLDINKKIFGIEYIK